MSSPNVMFFKLNDCLFSLSLHGNRSAALLVAASVGNILVVPDHHVKFGLRTLGWARSGRVSRPAMPEIATQRQQDLGLPRMQPSIIMLFALEARRKTKIHAIVRAADPHNGDGAFLRFPFATVGEMNQLLDFEVRTGCGWDKTCH